MKILSLKYGNTNTFLVGPLLDDGNAFVGDLEPRASSATATPTVRRCRPISETVATGVCQHHIKTG